MTDDAKTTAGGHGIRTLIVDNDHAHAQAMAESLQRIGFGTTVATSGPAGAEQIEKDTFDVVITDLVMPEVDGMEILDRAKQFLPDCEVVVVTGHATVPKAVEAMQLGAFNFLEKPITPNRLRAVAERAADAVRLRWQNLELNQRLDERFGFEKIIYASSQMKAVVDRLRRVAPTDADVLIIGDSGTGKELVAQAIHQNSPRKKKPYVALNCAAIPEHLVESELFGHVKGAFTHALTDKEGKFEFANGGTVFLDEIGDMPANTQSKLLRVLEEREVTRVGGNKSTKVNVRVVSATNRDLDQAIRDGKFRQDLFYRLNVVTVTIPPLSERRDDIIPLADFFRRQFAKENGKPVARIAPDVTKIFFQHAWKGNVRELRNVIRHMVLFDQDDELGVDDLPPELAGVEVSEEAIAAAGPVSLIGRPMEEIECWAIEQTLALTKGNREEAARTLGIGARTLYRKLEKYNLQ